MIFFNPNGKNANKKSKKCIPYLQLVDTLDTNDLGLMDSLLNLQNNEILVINILSDIKSIKKVKKINFFNQKQHRIAQEFINYKNVKYVGSKNDYQLSFSAEDMQQIIKQDINNISPRLLSNIDVIQNVFNDITGSSKEYGFIILEIYIKNSNRNNNKTYYIMPLGEDVVNQLYGLVSQYGQMGATNNMMNNNDQDLSDEVKDFLPKDSRKNNKFKKLKRLKTVQVR